MMIMHRGELDRNGYGSECPFFFGQQTAMCRLGVREAKPHPRRATMLPRKRGLGLEAIPGNSRDRSHPADLPTELPPKKGPSGGPGVAAKGAAADN